MDHAIDPAPFRNRGLSQGVALVCLGHIAGHSNGIATRGMNVGRERVNSLDGPRGDNDLGALSRRPAAHGLAHARACASYNNNLIFQDHGALSSFIF
jgi:hypothetical protein